MVNNSPIVSLYDRLCCQLGTLLPLIWPSMQPFQTKLPLLHHRAKWGVKFHHNFIAISNVHQIWTRFCRLPPVHLSKLLSKLPNLVHTYSFQSLATSVQSFSLASNQVLIICTGERNQSLLQLWVAQCDFFHSQSRFEYNFLFILAAGGSDHCHFHLTHDGDCFEAARNWLNPRTLWPAVFGRSFSGWTSSGDDCAAVYHFSWFMILQRARFYRVGAAAKLGFMQRIAGLYHRALSAAKIHELCPVIYLQ